MHESLTISEMMPQSAVIRARYIPDVRGINRYKHFHSPLVTETNEAGENIDKRGSSHELPYLDTGDLTRYSGRLYSDIAFTVSDDNYLDTKSGLNSRQRLSVGLLQVNALSNTSHQLSLSSSLPMLASASKQNGSLKPLTKRPSELNRSTQNIYMGSDEHFTRISMNRRHRSCYAKLTEGDTLRCHNGDAISLSPGTFACKLNSSWPSWSAKTVQIPKVEEKKFRNTSCGRGQRNDEALPKGGNAVNRETSCQRKHGVHLVDCAAGADETYTTKTLGTQTAVLEKGKQADKLESLMCKATQTPTPFSSFICDVHGYDAESEQRNELMRLIDCALNETIDRCSRLRTNQFIASSIRKQAQVWRDAKEFVTSVLLPQSILLANSTKSTSVISYAKIAAIPLP